MPEIKKYLSKDGLEDYNELLPHSATQMQEYVSDWLDEHPEVTTTVQDGSITTVKLANGSVTGAKMADGSVTSAKLTQSVRESISLSRASDALMGEPSEGTWVQRESTGIGMARVESVQGSTEVQNNELIPVQIAGIASTDANGGELDAIEWSTQTLRAAGSVADMLYSDHVDVRVGVVDLGTLTWYKGNALTDGTGHVFRAVLTTAPVLVTNIPHVQCAELTPVAYTNPYEAITKGDTFVTGSFLIVGGDSALDAAQFKTSMDGVILWYELANPTTTPISPTLPMSYKVEQGGTEAMIVPDGEVSAAPLITVSEGESAANIVMNALAAIASPDGPIAATNHPINTYLTMSGKLYKVTTAIAAGETIAAGTNVIQTTVMAELIARTA